jgi:anti-sigma-K factor RskA
MTDPHDLSPEDEADALAAEYVLGVLTLEDRMAAEARIKSDAAFAARVARWETHFEALNDGYASAPAPDLMPQIEAGIFGRQERQQGQQDVRKRSWWRFVTGAGVAAALAVAALLILPPSGDSGPTLTASLAADTQELAFSASYSDGELTLAQLSGSEAEAGQDYELWLIVGDAAPVSLGLITDATTTRTLDGLEPGAVLAVSLEPTGGSTTGAPTGPVLVTGVVAAS